MLLHKNRSKFTPCEQPVGRSIKPKTLSVRTRREKVALPEGEKENWFTPDEGISFVNAIIEYIKAKPKEVKNAEGGLGDFAEYAEFFGKAKTVGEKWHLNLDI